MDISNPYAFGSSSSDGFYATGGANYGATGGFGGTTSTGAEVFAAGGAGGAGYTTIDGGEQIIGQTTTQTTKTEVVPTEVVKNETIETEIIGGWDPIGAGGEVVATTTTTTAQAGGFFGDDGVNVIATGDLQTVTDMGTGGYIQEEVKKVTEVSRVPVMVTNEMVPMYNAPRIQMDKYLLAEEPAMGFVYQPTSPLCQVGAALAVLGCLASLILGALFLRKDRGLIPWIFVIMSAIGLLCALFIMYVLYTSKQSIENGYDPNSTLVATALIMALLLACFFIAAAIGMFLYRPFHYANLASKNLDPPKWTHYFGTHTCQETWHKTSKWLWMLPLFSLLAGLGFLFTAICLWKMNRHQEPVGRWVLAIACFLGILLALLALYYLYKLKTFYSNPAMYCMHPPLLTTLIVLLWVGVILLFLSLLWNVFMKRSGHFVFAILLIVYLFVLVCVIGLMLRNMRQRQFSIFGNPSHTFDSATKDSCEMSCSIMLDAVHQEDIKSFCPQKYLPENQSCTKPWLASHWEQTNAPRFLNPGCCTQIMTFYLKPVYMAGFLCLLLIMLILVAIGANLFLSDKSEYLEFTDTKFSLAEMIFVILALLAIIAFVYFIVFKHGKFHTPRTNPNYVDTKFLNTKKGAFATGSSSRQASEQDFELVDIHKVYNGVLPIDSLIPWELRQNESIRSLQSMFDNVLDSMANMGESVDRYAGRAAEKVGNAASSIKEKVVGLASRAGDKVAYAGEKIIGGSGDLIEGVQESDIVYEAPGQAVSTVIEKQGYINEASPSMAARAKQNMSRMSKKVWSALGFGGEQYSPEYVYRLDKVGKLVRLQPGESSEITFKFDKSGRVYSSDGQSFEIDREGKLTVFEGSSSSQGSGVEIEKEKKVVYRDGGQVKVVDTKVEYSNRPEETLREKILHDYPMLGQVQAEQSVEVGSVVTPSIVNLIRPDPSAARYEQKIIKDKIDLHEIIYDTNVRVPETKPEISKITPKVPEPVFDFPKIELDRKEKEVIIKEKDGKLKEEIIKKEEKIEIDVAPKDIHFDPHGLAGAILVGEIIDGRIRMPSANEVETKSEEVIYTNSSMYVLPNLIPEYNIHGLPPYVSAKAFAMKTANNIMTLRLNPELCGQLNMCGFRFGVIAVNGKFTPFPHDTPGYAGTGSRKLYFDDDNALNDFISFCGTAEHLNALFSQISATPYDVASPMSIIFKGEQLNLADIDSSCLRFGEVADIVALEPNGKTDGNLTNYKLLGYESDRSCYYNNTCISEVKCFEHHQMVVCKKGFIFYPNDGWVNVTVPLTVLDIYNRTVQYNEATLRSESIYYYNGYKYPIKDAVLEGNLLKFTVPRPINGNVDIHLHLFDQANHYLTARNVYYVYPYFTYEMVTQDLLLLTKDGRGCVGSNDVKSCFASKSLAFADINVIAKDAVSGNLLQNIPLKLWAGLDQNRYIVQRSTSFFGNTTFPNAVYDYYTLVFDGDHKYLPGKTPIRLQRLEDQDVVIYLSPRNSMTRTLAHYVDEWGTGVNKDFCMSVVTHNNRACTVSSINKFCGFSEHLSENHFAKPGFEQIRVNHFTTSNYLTYLCNPVAFSGTCPALQTNCFYNNRSPEAKAALRETHYVPPMSYEPQGTATEIIREEIIEEVVQPGSETIIVKEGISEVQVGNNAAEVVKSVQVESAGPQFVESKTVVVEAGNAVPAGQTVLVEKAAKIVEVPASGLDSYVIDKSGMVVTQRRLGFDWSKVRKLQTNNLFRTVQCFNGWGFNTLRSYRIDVATEPTALVCNQFYPDGSFWSIANLRFRNNHK